MKTIKQIHLSLITLLYAGVMVLASCANEVDPFSSSEQKSEEGTGTLEISLEGNAATRATTKVSAEEAKKFLITIFKGMGASQQTIKPATLLEELGTSLRLDAGYGYSIMAQSCTEEDAEKESQGWGKRRYVGTSQSFAIIAGQTTKVSVPCKVANGGISAYFDPSITASFSNYNATITIKNDAGETVRNLVFDKSNCDYKEGDDIIRGKIAYFNIPEEGRSVHYSVTVGSQTKEFDQDLEVAKIKRISVSYKSGTFSFEISVYDEEIYITDEITVEPDPTLTERIPVVTTKNVYDLETHELVGTELKATYPLYDTEWSGVVKNGNGEVVRTLSAATGDITSGADDANWPYLPTGNYALEFTYENYAGITVNKSTAFNITEEPNFQASLNAFTTYSYAQDGNLTEANKLENTYKIMAPTVTVTGISDALIQNGKYGFATTFSNSEKTPTQSNPNVVTYKDYTVSNTGEYNLSATVKFANRTITAGKTVYITGIPHDANPPKTNIGWTNPKGDVKWEDK